jgi:hypothetical protein
MAKWTEEEIRILEDAYVEGLTSIDVSKRLIENGYERTPSAVRSFIYREFDEEDPYSEKIEELVDEIERSCCCSGMCLEDCDNCEYSCSCKAACGEKTETEYDEVEEAFCGCGEVPDVEYVHNQDSIRDAVVSSIFTKEFFAFVKEAVRDVIEETFAGVCETQEKE